MLQNRSKGQGTRQVLEAILENIEGPRDYVDKKRLACSATPLPMHVPLVNRAFACNDAVGWVSPRRSSTIEAGSQKHDQNPCSLSTGSVTFRLRP
jgi:hypothetical protein